MTVTLSTTYVAPAFNFVTYLENTTPEVEANNALANIIGIGAQLATYRAYLEQVQDIDGKQYYVAPDGGLLLREQIEEYIGHTQNSIAHWALALAAAVRRSDKEITA